MRYIFIIPDGAADRPSGELGGKTPMEAADIPYMRLLAREGRTGLAKTVPDGMKPGSDVACLSLLGYDPKTGYTGRAALEAASLGVTIPEGDAIFRANMVTVIDGVMKDYSAGHISTPEATEVVESLNRDLKIDGVVLTPGVGYRHLCLIEGAALQIPACTPPHDILGKNIDEHAPQGGFSSWVLEVERTSAELMPRHPVNVKRLMEGKCPATQLWLWGGATAMRLARFRDKFGVSAGLVSAVDLMRGIGRLAGMDVLTVEGATGYYDTNYAGKGQAALDYLRDHEFIAVHVEATDEAGHNGDAAAKIAALENIDRHIVKPIYEEAKRHKDWRLLVSPDHPTPLELRTHTPDPVPFILWGPDVRANGAEAYSEREAARVGGEAVVGTDLVSLLMAR